MNLKQLVAKEEKTLRSRKHWRLTEPKPQLTKFLPVFQNQGSKLATPASVLIDHVRARQGIIARWDWDRYTRLCCFLNYTPAELASAICLSHEAMARAEGRNRFPGPACLLLTLLEYTVMEKYTTDVIKDALHWKDPNDSPQGA